MVDSVIVGTRGTRFGNHLYFYLQASKHDNMYVEYENNMAYWNNHFKKLNALTTFNRELDQNINKVYISYSYFQIFGMEYTLNDINLFIKHYLSEDLVDYLDGDGYELIINIRRTDFYSDALKYFYGFNQIKYVKKAIRKFDKFSKIAVISDDIDWCKEHLAFLNKKYKQVDFLSFPPFESFIELIKAKNLIIANSTFSFWAAYINHYFNPSSRIVAPNYYTSLINNGELITSPGNWETINVTIYKDKSKIIKTYLSKIKHKVIALAKKIRKVLIGR